MTCTCEIWVSKDSKIGISGLARGELTGPPVIIGEPGFCAFGVRSIRSIRMVEFEHSERGAQAFEG